MSDICTVFYESWQMECCGEPFVVGDNVKWLVCRGAIINGIIGLGKIDYFYEGHSSDWENIFVLEGKVESIKILFEKYVSSSAGGSQTKVPVEGKLLDSTSVTGDEVLEDREDMDASGYVVVLSGCTCKPAKKEEITF